jgi:hypothetical protein
MSENVAKNRRFWVVSPNVRNDNHTVGEWRRLSVAWHAAFMAYRPDDHDHKESGYKFAHIIRPNDVLLIARRFERHPEIVGFGIVKGRFKKNLKGLRTPEKFGSLRRLWPFRHVTSTPKNLPIMDALSQTTALRELHPNWYPSHRSICKWMEERLFEKARTNSRPSTISSTTSTRIVTLPHEHELEFQVRTKRNIRTARKIEAALVGRYREWLRDGDHTLAIVRYKNFRCDAYEKERGNLIEAKSSSSREYIRMAVGQLLDYSYLGRQFLGNPNMAILLPERPDLEALDWVSESDISFVWEERGTFVDNKNGRFT